MEWTFSVLPSRAYLGYAFISWTQTRRWSEEDENSLGGDQRGKDVETFLVLRLGTMPVQADHHHLPISIARILVWGPLRCAKAFALLLMIDQGDPSLEGALCLLNRYYVSILHFIVLLLETSGPSCQRQIQMAIAMSTTASTSTPLKSQRVLVPSIARLSGPESS